MTWRLGMVGYSLVMMLLALYHGFYWLSLSWVVIGSLWYMTHVISKGRL